MLTPCIRTGFNSDLVHSDGVNYVDGRGEAVDPPERSWPLDENDIGWSLTAEEMAEFIPVGNVGDPIVVTRQKARRSMRQLWRDAN